MAEPLVSVVVPVFNGARFLAEALASVFAQTYRRFEVIVVDDGSTDDSRSIATGWSGVRLVAQPNRGVAAARNAGIEAAHGELLAFLDQDDTWTADKLTIQAGLMHTRPELGLAVSHHRIVVEPGTDLPTWVRPETLDRPLPAYTASALVARRASFERLGHFDESLPEGSDTDWFLRAIDANVPLAVVPQVLMVKRIHTANQSALVDVSHAQLLRTVRRSVARKQHRAADPEGTR